LVIARDRLLITDNQYHALKPVQNIIAWKSRSSRNLSQ
jgi:hypothetical protein